jgi:hypothetical protein
VNKQSLTSLRDARSAPRFPTKMEAVLRVGQERVPIVIGDISRTGALVCGPMLPIRGQRVALVARGLEVTATVVWSGNESCGLSFHAAVDPLAVVRENLAQFAWLKRRKTDPPEPTIEK